jgi:serine/threonine-protein kinase
MNIREGDVVAGKYRIERVLGMGGMGMVVAARHVALDEPVAIKVLLPEMLEEQEAVARFLREARAAARIKSEHVARVSDVGELESGAPYMVMEYLDGQDLAAVLKARGPLPIEEAVDYVVQTCEAIAGAHALGIVHRDLKPSNLMLITKTDGSPCIKVLDFGISKFLSKDASMAMTRTAAILGSPLYMSPEQMTSARDVDGRADVWSIGTILYELLTGSPPFTASSLPGLAMLIATTPHRPMRDLRPEIPAGLDAVIVGCLAKQRDERFASVAELAAALAPFAPEHAAISIRSSARILGASEPPKARSMSVRPPEVAPLSTAPVVRSKSDVRELKVADTVVRARGGHAEKPRRTLWLALGGTVLAGIVALGTFALSERRNARTAAEPSEMASQVVIVPVASMPVSDEARNPRLDDTAVPATTKTDESSAPATAPVSPAASKPPVRSATPSKPTSATKTKPSRAPAISKPPAKQPESAYEHM